MDRQDFDRAIGEAPPSTVDVDAVIAKNRRAGFVNRVTSPWVTTSLAVIVVTFGTAALLLPHDGEGGATPAQPPPPSTTPRPAPTEEPKTCYGVFPPPPAVTEKPAVTETRLSSALNQLVRSKLSNAQLSAHLLGKDPNGKQHGPLQFFYGIPDAVEVPPDEVGCPNVEDYFTSAAVVSTTKGKGNIQAHIGRLGNRASPQRECPTGIVTDVVQTCAREVKADGTVVLRVTMTFEGVKVNRLEASKPDGTGILMHAENVAKDAKYGGPPDSANPPLTFDQLEQIALDPKLTMYPTS